MPARALLIFCSVLILAGIQTTGFATPEEKPAFKGTTALRTRDCVITHVGITAARINIEFTGHWEQTPDLPVTVDHPEVDRHGIVIFLDQEGDPALLAKLGAEAKKLIGQRVNIVVAAKGGLDSRGGIPIVSVPIDRVQITAIAKH